MFLYVESTHYVDAGLVVVRTVESCFDVWATFSPLLPSLTGPPAAYDHVSGGRRDAWPNEPGINEGRVS